MLPSSVHRSASNVPEGIKPGLQWAGTASVCIYLASRTGARYHIWGRDQDHGQRGEVAGGLAEHMT